MNNKNYNIKPFVELGRFLNQFSREKVEKKINVLHNDLFFDAFKHQIKIAHEHNGWFTKTNVLYAIEGWAELLSETKLQKWLEAYPTANSTPKTIAVIMAGNIPLVGFHDFLCAIITGHHVLVKLSSNDKQLLPMIAKYLEYVDPSLKGSIRFTEDKLTEFDAVIATGSNNTARYFEHYFKGKPSIIRKNRNSIAVLTGNETEDDLKALSNDIFRYYGLGCRNVSKLFVPEGYDFDAFFKAMYHWHPIIEEQKYANNYDYNKAVYLMSEFDMLENGFLMIKEDESFASPIATIFYQYYNSIEDLKQLLNENKENIQCIVGNDLSDSTIAFGDTQTPQLWDYADGIDTIEFLINL